MVFALNHLCRRLQVGRSAQHMKNGWQVLCWVFSFEPGARIDSKEQVYLGLPSYGVLRAFAEWSNCPDYGVRHGRLSRLSLPRHFSQTIIGMLRPGLPGLHLRLRVNGVCVRLPLRVSVLTRFVGKVPPPRPARLTMSWTQLRRPCSTRMVRSRPRPTCPWRSM